MGQVQITPPPLSSQALADLMCTIILLCHARHEDGSPFWAYLCIKPSMAKAFQEARDSGTMDIEEFGTVLEWGEGEEVPPETRAHMERDYAVKHDYEKQLLQAIQVTSS